ncbi:MAG TPA: HIT domain-containing protein [Phycisphaerales bacterium]|nr:HIT domain-containing protein [Phycisphaerales bacterium]
MPSKPDNPHNPNPAGPDQLQAPWRLRYIEELGRVEREQSAQADRRKAKPDTGCFIRDYWLTPEDDHDNHIIRRTDSGMIFLNRYPYANGHLLVALGESRPRLLDYTAPERAALWMLVDEAADLMERTLEPHGINIGLNQGRAAGAGVPQHVHVHLVPRWTGDVNFITTVGTIRVIPGSLEAMAERYRVAAAGM